MSDTALPPAVDDDAVVPAEFRHLYDSVKDWRTGKHPLRYVYEDDATNVMAYADAIASGDVVRLPAGMTAHEFKAQQAKTATMMQAYERELAAMQQERVDARIAKVEARFAAERARVEQEIAAMRVSRGQ